MGSFINYKFVNSKNTSKINFEGTSMLGWELKSEIVVQKQMLSEDFELLLFENEEELNDDTVIYRNSSILVKRIPLWMAKTKSQIQRESIKQRKQKVPPPNYVCFRCGDKGHFIQFCPTNQDKNFDVVRVRKPTGIPKAFLVESNEPKEGNLIDERGSFVKIQPQVEEWYKIQGVLKSNIPSNLVCSVCHEIYKNPVILQCNHSFCEGCVKEFCDICGNKVENKRMNLNLRKEVEIFFNK
ncbi:ring zinc finger domain-containing protein [Tubulinosema ratisbonensis]|uniref:Ring zinc finger domain-containing protein n=1 Tax=Tubulinosema ratisbonensis TaxID=291195 RepID=A0A437APP6_9MICR|nr:ring zinc finger domain-containing protein [Tubulinosema ratisbonensis]